MKNKKNKFDKVKFNKKLVITATVILVSVLSVIGLNFVYAALKDNDQEENDFKISNLKGEITEKFTPPTAANPIKPGIVHEKEVKIKNTEDSPFFVRAIVIPEIQDKDKAFLPSKIGENLHVTANKDWVLGEDGFYYYLKKVSEGEETTPIFNSVRLDSRMYSEYNDASLKIALKSETVISSEDNYRKAWWQGKVPSEKNLKIVDNALQTIVREGK